MNAKKDLTDVTFLIPVRIDSMDRLENLEMVLDFLFINFDTNVYVLEASTINNNYISKLFPKIDKVIYVEDFDPIYCKTKYVNQLVRACQTQYLSVWDSDAIVPPNQIEDSVKMLREKKADFVLPYEKNLFDTTKIIRDLYYQNRDINFLTNNCSKMKNMYPPISVGGGYFANRKSYIESGIENTNFYGWGLEDGERLHRWDILGYKTERTLGNMFHLTHWRGISSNFHSKEQQNMKNVEYINISNMTKEQLQKEVISWNHEIEH